MKPNSDQGQMFSGEFILGFILFAVAFAMMISLWDTTTRDVLRAESIREMNDAAVNAAETLVRTPGVPSDWNRSNVASLGLANQSRILHPLKVKEFVHYMSTNETGLCGSEKNYQCNLHMLGLGGYDFMMNISYVNGTTVNVNGTPAYVGRPPVNETERITVLRTTILNDEITRLYLTVWK
ncbi:MAG: hypothetical protein V1875_02385 [Candidatus Altiarchaeota archaeon]